MTKTERPKPVKVKELALEAQYKSLGNPEIVAALKQMKQKPAEQPQDNTKRRQQP